MLELLIILILIYFLVEAYTKRFKGIYNKICINVFGNTSNNFLSVLTPKYMVYLGFLRYFLILLILLISYLTFNNWKGILAASVIVTIVPLIAIFLPIPSVHNILKDMGNSLQKVKVKIYSDFRNADGDVINLIERTEDEIEKMKKSL